MASVAGWLRAAACASAVLIADRAGAQTCPSQFQLPADAVCDFNGEVCRSGSEVVDGLTYCTMQGRLKAGEALEMDDIENDVPAANDAQSVADANVFLSQPGCIPAGQSTCNDPDLPQVSGATYIDWNDLKFDAVTRPDGLVPVTQLNLLPTGRPIGSVENHRIVDYTANEDYSIFASGGCVTDGSSLPKEDFTESYLGNNDDFLYFAQERRTNSGNSVYYWLLTLAPPKIVPGGGKCGANTRGELQFTLNTGDVQVIANFPSSSDPASGKVFLRRYSGPTVTQGADLAVFAAGWSEVPGAVRTFALVLGPSRGNEADDKQPDWGGFDSQGKATAQNGSLFYATAGMAEWAIDLGDLFGATGICGEKLFLTGISRSATGQVTDPTEPADLKDLVGPKLYSFGSVEASGSLTAICDPEEGLDYLFDFSAGATSVSGQNVPLGDLACTWTCTSDACDDPTLAFTHASQCTGRGTIARSGGPADRGPCDVSCSVTVQQASSQCSSSSDEETTALAPILVRIDASPDARSCEDELGIGSGITYVATVNGGDLDYSYTWSVSGPSPACGDSTSCNVSFDASDYCASATLSVTVDDGSICPEVDSESESVTKVTAIQATNN